jgi:hypothetical protein
MKSLVLSVPAFGFVVGTRVALAFGVGLLVSPRLPESRRRALGLALVALGAATTVPAVMTVTGRTRFFNRGRRQIAVSPVSQDRRLIGAERFPRKGDDD